jgi:hypothetical protein
MRPVRHIAWDAADLVRRLCGALDFAREAVERLAAKGYDDAAEPAARVRPEKLIGETAILLYAASAVVGRPELRARIDAVARLLIAHARSERIALGICLEPSLALEYAEAHICLSRLGYPDPRFDALLRQSVTSQAGSGRERVPHRALEQQWIAGIWRQCTAQPCRRPARRTLDLILKRPLDVHSSGLDEAYAFTHALMYVSDFNHRPRRPPRSRAAIAAEAEAALARCLDQENYDLGGEMLMTWPLTGAPWSAGAAFGFRVLAHLEDREGILPAPGVQADPAGKCEGAPRTDKELARGYHTAYVMGLLCAAALGPGRAPPTEFSAHPTRSQGAVEAFLRFLDGDGQSPFWRQELDRVTAAERDGLAGLLLAIALNRKVRRREFESVHALLQLSAAFDLANAPACSQAAEMLERLAVIESVLGKPPSEPPPAPALHAAA